MASVWIFSCRAAGGMGSSAVKSFVLPRKFNGGNRILFPGAKITPSSIDLSATRDFSGIRTNPRILLKHCNAQKKDEISDSANSVRFQQAALWSAEAAYIIWLFLLPYAPGDPVWAISPATITELIGLSLNFFFVLPIMNSAGIHVLESPVIHPMSEGLFNFVLGWTLMFAPLLFTDSRRERFKGSLDLLWGLQMFLTNTFLIPYMAIRLSESNGVNQPKKSQPLVSALTRAATVVAITGGGICVLSIYWALLGRPGVDFGGVARRVEFFWRYVGSERFAYAFVWDIVLYSIFQPWLIGENLENLREESVESAKILRPRNQTIRWWARPCLMTRSGDSDRSSDQAVFQTAARPTVDELSGGEREGERERGRAREWWLARCLCGFPCPGSRPRGQRASRSSPTTRCGLCFVAGMRQPRDPIDGRRISPPYGAVASQPAAASRASLGAALGAPGGPRGDRVLCGCGGNS